MIFMKKWTIALTLITFALTSYGQKKVKPVWDETTGQITVNGEDYAKMVKKKSDVITGKDWWIMNSDDKVIIQFKTETYTTKEWKDGRYVDVTNFRVVVLFPESGSYAYVNASALGFGPKGVMKKLTRNELIADQDLDWEKTIMFINANNGRLREAPEPGISETPITLEDNKIFQDGELIGSYKKREVDNNYEYHIYNNDGAKVATSKIEVEDPFEWVIVDANGKEQSFMYENDADGIKMFDFLVQKGILKN
jgi:hypothetical protein